MNDRGPRLIGFGEESARLPEDGAAGASVYPRIGFPLSRCRTRLLDNFRQIPGTVEREECEVAMVWSTSRKAAVVAAPGLAIVADLTWLDE